MSLQYLKKEVRDGVNFGIQINIKVSHKLISARWALMFSTRWFYHSLIGMIKHFQSIQYSKFAISLQYLKNEVSHKTFYWKYNQQNFIYVIKYSSTTTAFVFYCDTKHPDILWGPVMFVVTLFNSISNMI